MKQHTPRRVRGLRERTVEGERVIVDRRFGRVHQLNATASFIWERCDGVRTVADIAGELAAAYDLGREQAETDVANAIQQLIDIGLLTPPEGADPP